MAKRKPPLGSGGRFAGCVRDVERRGGAVDARAVCAAAGRKKYGAAAMAKMAAAGRRRANPQDAAEAAYQQFHGKASTKVDVYEQRIHVHGFVWQLGRLIELRVLHPEGREFVLGPFRGVKLTASEDGGQLYFVGGDQELDLQTLGHSDDLPKDQVLIGVATGIVYHTTKDFHDFEPTDYDHQFGEETGEVPVMGYDTRSKLFYLVGGAYQVRREGIVN